MRRVIELVLVLIIFPAILILLLMCIVTIAAFDPGPIFFKSRRLGKNQQAFTMVKLRTMSPNAPLVPSSHKDASLHVTKLGQFMRVTSLDELPQIFNILNGSMSFIGPRPCLASESRLIELREDKNIFATRPGVTGLAQVRGRDRNSERNKVRYEFFYSKKKCFLFDLKIIIMTMKAIIKFSNVSH
jgi:O-antigen biosynthesis protein WbqP